MAFKLNQTQESQFNDLMKKVDNAYDEVGGVVTAYNEKLAEMKSPVEEAITAYNAALGELKMFVDTVATEMRAEFEGKSESWQEGETGQEVSEWIDTWEGAELDDVSITFPDELTVEFENAAGTDLTTEP